MRPDRACQSSMGPWSTQPSTVPPRRIQALGAELWQWRPLPGDSRPWERSPLRACQTEPSTVPLRQLQALGAELWCGVPSQATLGPGSGAVAVVLDKPRKADASHQLSTPNRQPMTGSRHDENQFNPSRCTPSAAAVGARRALPTRAFTVANAVRIPTVMMRTLGACIVGGCGESSYIPTSGL